MISAEVIKRILSVRLLLLDVDGVLTPGSIIYSDSGEEIKVFSVKDGLGIRLLMDAGIRVGIITGRRSGALSARCKNLGIDLVYDGVKDKVAVLDTIANELGITYDEISFTGDDLPDLGVMKRIGCPFAVGDAAPEIRNAAIYTTDSNGGNGAVREICELILKTRGVWDQVLEQFE